MSETQDASTGGERIIPRHIAVVMDGNGRWATERGLERLEGHYEGVKAARRFVEAADSRGVEVVSLYVFSSENKSRPAQEVMGLLELIQDSLVGELERLCAERTQLRCSGRMEGLPQGVRSALEEVRDATASNEGMVLNLCVNYGGRAEIADAAKAIAAEVQAGTLDLEAIDEETVQSHLYHPDLPSPDLLIRPGGELRVSNFLLWEIAYTEFFVLPIYWPAFTEEHLDEAIDDFNRRQRRFGGRAKTEE